MSNEEMNQQPQNSGNDKNLVLIGVLGGIVGFILPLFIYATKKNELSEYGKQMVTGMLNFQINVLVIMIISYVLAVIPVLGWLIAALVPPVVGLYALYVVIMATMAINDRKDYNYPCFFKVVS